MCDRSRAHKRGRVQAVVNQGTFGMGREEALGLAPHTEKLTPQIPPQTIQEGDNNKEALAKSEISSLVLTAYLESTRRGHGLPKENNQAVQSGNPGIPDPGT